MVIVTVTMITTDIRIAIISVLRINIVIIITITMITCKVLLAIQFGEETSGEIRTRCSARFVVLIFCWLSGVTSTLSLTGRKALNTKPQALKFKGHDFSTRPGLLPEDSTNLVHILSA